MTGQPREQGLRPTAMIGLLIALAGAGCGTVLPGRDCEWPSEAARRLDLTTAADRWHLIDDARDAEEIAIRHADAFRGRRSGHYAGAAEYAASRKQCLTAMTGAIANRHGLQPAQVAEAVGRRDDRLDALVLLCFAAVFGFAANSLARGVLRRFRSDGWRLALLGTAAAALFISAAGVMLGGLGASVVEMIQLGNTHLSYRAGRTPLAQHQVLFFVCGVALFGVITAVRWPRYRPAGHGDA